MVHQYSVNVSTTGIANAKVSNTVKPVSMWKKQRKNFVDGINGLMAKNPSSKHVFMGTQGIYVHDVVALLNLGE
jgi:hypothetical protein